MNIISSIQEKFTNNDNNDHNENDIEDTHIDSNFKLPIEYLDNEEVMTLSETVSNDLELVKSADEDNKCIYDILLEPTHCFSKQNIPLWNQKYTTNTSFLKDTQKIIQKMQTFKSHSENDNKFNLEEILPIWKNIKQNSFFHEKYNYLDWDMLKHLNESSPFLQILSCIHLLSPVISFMLPLFLLIFPFIILKIQRVPINFSIYFSTLKQVAKNHTIGKILFNMGSMDWDKIVYLLFTIGIYIFQMYQNVILCKRFYKNIIHINKDLLFIKEYCKYTINNMYGFGEITNGLNTYNQFMDDTVKYRNSLEKLLSDLNNVTEFDHSMQKAYSIGYMLRLYYTIHINHEYEEALKYSVGFNGYIDNISNLHNLICNGSISFADFNESNICTIDNQYYPVIIDNKCIKNNLNMEKNIVISAPNKAGKTTYIKSTLINIIFTQQFGCGFYEYANITPYKFIHCYLNIPDTSGRDSLFQAESRRCKEIINIIKANENERHFCIFDELYSGTNPDEAVKAGKAFLKYLENYNNVNFILTTHYKQICKHFKNSKKVENYKMVVNINSNDSFDYTYKCKKGISNIKGGIRVLKDMEYPDEIINNIENNA